MKRALTFATGLTVGYVAGTKAGREKYEQMRLKMHEVSQQPAVAEMRENLQEQVGAATKVVAGKVTDVASEVSKKLHISSGNGTVSGHQNAAKTTPGGAMG